MKTKTFDCVEMQHQAQLKVQHDMEGMTLEEKLAYWQKVSEEMKARQTKARAQRKLSEAVEEHPK